MFGPLTHRIPGQGPVISRMPEPLQSICRRWHYRLVENWKRRHDNTEPPNWLRAILAANAVKFAKREYSGFDWRKWGLHCNAYKGYHKAPKHPNGQIKGALGASDEHPNSTRLRLRMRKNWVEPNRSGNTGTF